MRFKLFLLLLLFPVSVFVLEVSPWFGEVYEFYFLGKYAYSRYDQVQGSIQPLNGASNDNLFYFDLASTPSAKWGLDGDLEFVKTPRQHFGFRSVAFQARYLWSDDIVGDSLTIATGLNARIVSQESLHDVSCPYHSNSDFEGNIAIGKEFAQSDRWQMRFWIYGALGIANRGSPWLKGAMAIEGNIEDTRRWAVFINGDHGYGKRNFIDIEHFNGYSRTRYKNIDIGFRFGYKFDNNGTLSFEYKRRVLAKLCPERVNTFSISYLLPFSF